MIDVDRLGAEVVLEAHMHLAMRHPHVALDKGDSGVEQRQLAGLCPGAPGFREEPDLHGKRSHRIVGKNCVELSGILFTFVLVSAGQRAKQNPFIRIEV